MPVATSSRPPAAIAAGATRRPSRPAYGATTIGIAVHHSVCRPTESGPSPRAWERNWISMRKPANIANASRKLATFALENALERNRRSGIIGCAERRSHHRKPASSAVPAA